MFLWKLSSLRLISGDSNVYCLQIKDKPVLLFNFSVLLLATQKFHVVWFVRVFVTVLRCLKEERGMAYLFYGIIQYKEKQKLQGLVVIISDHRKLM